MARERNFTSGDTPPSAFGCQCRVAHAPGMGLNSRGLFNPTLPLQGRQV